jgi:hypothetical protein
MKIYHIANAKKKVVMTRHTPSLFLKNFKFVCPHLYIVHSIGQIRIIFGYCPKEEKKKKKDYGRNHL